MAGVRVIKCRVSQRPSSQGTRAVRSQFSPGSGQSGGRRRGRSGRAAGQRPEYRPVGGGDTPTGSPSLPGGLRCRPKGATVHPIRRRCSRAKIARASVTARAPFCVGAVGCQPMGGGRGRRRSGGYPGTRPSRPCRGAGPPALLAVRASPASVPLPPTR